MNARSTGTARRGRKIFFSTLSVVVAGAFIWLLLSVQVDSRGSALKSKWGAGKAMIHILAADIDAYVSDNGVPPVRLEDLVIKPGNASNWKGPYVRASGLKDPFDHAFQYKAPGEHGDFDIVFLGKDGQSGGDGVNADYGNWQ